MALKPLCSNVIQLIQSGSEINSYEQAVLELVLNSLDAKANCIAVRIDFRNHNIQVIDNGIGINEANMKSIGQRYMTSKCESIADLNNKLNYYGFRGSALANLIKISETLTVESLNRASEHTFVKYFRKNQQRGDIEIKDQRPSYGTTITIRNFLYNMKIRQNYVNPLHDIEKIKTALETIALINYNTSFTLRDDQDKILVFKCQKAKSIEDRFSLLFNEKIGDGLKLTSYTDDVYSIDAYISKERYKSKQYQYVYVNKRYVKQSEVHKTMNKLLKLKKNTLMEDFCLDTELKKFPIFIINMICPFTTYDITLAPDKSTILFNDWDHVLKIIEKTIDSHDKNYEIKIDSAENETECKADEIKQMVKAVLQENANKFGTSQMQNAVKGKPAKRRRHGKKVNRNISPENIDVDDNFNTSRRKPSSPIINMLKNDIKKSSVINCNRSALSYKKISEVKCIVTEDKILDNATIKRRFEQISLNLNRVLNKIKKSHLKIQPKIGNYQNLNDIDINMKNRFKHNCLMEMKYKNKLRNNIVFKRTSKIHYILRHNFPQNKMVPYKNHRMFKPISTAGLIKTLVSKKDDYYHVMKNKVVTISQKTFESHINRKNYSIDKCHSYNYDNTIFSLKDIDSKSTMIKSNDKIKSSQITIVSNKSYHPSEGFEMINISDEIKYPNNINVKFVSQDTLVGSQHCNYISDKLPDVNLAENKNTNREDVNESVDIFLQTDEKMNLDQSEMINKERDDEMNDICIVSQMKRLKISDDQINTDEFRTFKLFKRPCFIPKGMSPILRLSEQNNINWSCAKNGPNDSINPYYDREMYKLFANDIHSNFVSNDILKMDKSMPLKLENQIKYDKNILRSAKIINQVDHKFILATFDDETYSHLVLFDQHAVDERIKLEKLLHDYQHDDGNWKTINCVKPINIILDQLNVNLMVKYREKFVNLGITFEINEKNTDKVIIKTIPYCFIQKLYDEISLGDIIERLVIDELKILNDTRGTISKTPKIMLDCINMEACRSAIKFGDILNKTECDDMIKSLSRCNLPFQCAHGRPSLITLINLKTLAKDTESKTSLKNLKCYKKPDVIYE